MATITVSITSPDAVLAILEPTLEDAIASARLYASTASAASASALASSSAAGFSASSAATSAATAVSAAASAAATAGAALSTTILSGTSSVVPKSKYLRQLRSDGHLQTVSDYMMNTASADTQLAWQYDPYVFASGLIWTSTQLALGGPGVYTNAMMIALMASAAALAN